MVDFEGVLLEVLLKITKELNYEGAETDIRPISSEGANYTSELFEATISAAGRDDINVFAKVACMGKEMRAIRTGNLYASEIFCYTNLLKKYKDIEAKHNVPVEHRLHTPICYGFNNEFMKETVVLENLKVKGYEAFDRFKTIDWQYASESIKQMAIFHALSIALSKYSPEEFEETKNILNSTYNVKDMGDMIQVVVTNALKVIKEENRERLCKFIQARIGANDFDEFLKPVRRPTIVHGDFRSSNIMYKVNDDGYKVIALDYQAARHGSPVTDLLFFIFTGSDREFRQRYLKSSIELYYKELCEALTRLNVDPEEVYSREDFDYEYKKLLPFGLIVAVFVLPVVTVAAASAPRPDAAPRDVNVPPSVLYADRLNHIIEEYVQMGVL